MSEQGWLQLKDLIHARIAELERNLGKMGRVSDKRRQQSDDEAANLDITINAAVEAKVLQSTKVELIRLRNKLRWLETEDAGYCEDCGCEVPFARLRASLGTRLCVTCAENKGE